MYADPETHRKMLEKMLQDAPMNDLGKNEGDAGNVISLGGAFTKKQSQLGDQAREAGAAGGSREGSNKKKEGQAQSGQAEDKQGVPDSGASLKPGKGDSYGRHPTLFTETKRDASKQAFDQYPERDSLGLFYVNPNALSGMAPMGGLGLNHEPLASIYTGAPEPASGIPQNLVTTPLLGGAMARLDKNGSECDQEEASQNQSRNGKQNSQGVNAFADNSGGKRIWLDRSNAKQIGIENLDMSPGDDVAMQDRQGKG